MKATLYSAYQISRKLHKKLSNFGLVLALVLLLSGCEGSTVIVNELEERDANELSVFLAGHRIQAEKILHVSGAGGGNAAASWNVAVKKTEKMRALTLLNNNGLPRRRSQNLLNLFQKQGLVSSEMEERIRYQAGIAEQIAGTIRKIDGVLDADIQISFPTQDALPGQNKKVEPITASVYVKHQGVLDNPNSHLILKIKQLVASAIPGLDFDLVTVISDRAIFNDPMSIALSKDPDIVSVWSIQVLKPYVFRLQLLLFSLIALSSFLLIAFLWIVWKVSKIISQVGGFKSVLSPMPWHLNEDVLGKDDAASIAEEKVIDQNPQEPKS
jgi:type III secretion protein J